MTVVAARAWTVEYVHGNHDKFYRTFAVDGDQPWQGYSVQQWGRNRTVGQFRIVSGKDQALAKRDEKEKEGYSKVGREYNVEFSVDLDQFRAKLAAGGDKEAGEFLVDQLRQRVGGTGPAVVKESCPDCGAKFNSITELVQHRNAEHPPEVTDTIPDRVGVLADRATEALKLAASDPIKAGVELVILLGEREKIAIDLRRADSYLDTIEMLIEEADV